VTEPAPVEGRVLCHPDLLRCLMQYLGRDHAERGGVLIGRRRDGETVPTCAVFPPQQARSSQYCSFDVAGIETIRSALDPATPGRTRPAPDGVDRIVGWIHSHPDIGAYLSGTDVETLRSWLHLDPGAVAVVLDPFADDFSHAVGAWGGAERRQVPLPITLERRSARARSLRSGSELARALRACAGPGGAWGVVTAEGLAEVYP
jgi:proteasome lid subunit RPN8/RPN11